MSDGRIPGSYWLPAGVRKVLLFSGLLSALLVLAACGSSQRAPVDEIGGGPRFLDEGRTHRVNAGETLYAVAWMYDLDFAALARANDLREPYQLTPGQTLRVDLRGLANSRAVVSSNVPVTTATTVATPTAVTVNPVQMPGGISRSTLGNDSPTRTPLPEAPAVTPPTAVPAPVTGLEPVIQEPAVSEPAPVTQPTPEPVPAPQVVTRAPEPTLPTPPVPQPVVPEPAPTEVVPPTAPATTTAPTLPAADAPIHWAWPADGRLIGRFSETDMDNKGVKLAGERGDPVRAAADGQIVYAGRGLLRYGDLIIIKHSERFLSAYAHNDRILVQEGAFVKQGDLVAELGSSGIDRTMLHFEIRVEGTPVDPLGLLPPK